MEDFVVTEETNPEVEPELSFPEETTPEEQFSLRIKYNGEEQELTKERAVELAQKGMNYDRIKEQLDKLKKSSEEDLSESRFNLLRNELDELKAREIAAKKWNEFRNLHGEYQKYSDLPEEVRASVSDGVELESAYAMYENKALKLKLAQMEQNLKNRESTPGSVSGSGAQETADDFLKGFFGM